MVDPAEVAALIGQTASYEPFARNYSDFHQEFVPTSSDDEDVFDVPPVAPTARR